MQITKDTRVSEILLKYNDIADVMEIFGDQRVGKYPCGCSSPKR